MSDQEQTKTVAERLAPIALDTLIAVAQILADGDTSEASIARARDVIAYAFAAVEVAALRRHEGEIKRLDGLVITVRLDERRACAKIASEWSMKPDASLCGLPFAELNEGARTAAHAAAQEIAMAIENSTGDL